MKKLVVKKASFKLQMDNKYGKQREANLVVQVGISPKVMCKDRGRMAKLERIRYFESKKKPSTKDCPE